MAAESPALGRGVRAAGLVVGVAASSALTAGLVGSAVARVAPSRMAPWLLGRAAGLSAYLLTLGLVGLGLWLSHPQSARLSGARRAGLVRLHVSAAVFTLAFTALHVVALASDRYAGVGWPGALLPGLSAYRPLPVSLGIIGLYAGVLAGITAAAAGRFARRVWWPIHKVAIVGLALVWTHGVAAGSDTPVLLTGYLASGAAVCLLAISRYVARNPGDELRRVRRAASVRRRSR